MRSFVYTRPQTPGHAFTLGPFHTLGGLQIPVVEGIPFTVSDEVGAAISSTAGACYVEIACTEPARPAALLPLAVAQTSDAVSTSPVVASDTPPPILESPPPAEAVATDVEAADAASSISEAPAKARKGTRK